MKNVFKNIAAVAIGLVVGSLVNGGIVSISGEIIPLPNGVDPNDVESIKANIHLYQPIHFLFPFLAHALGTLVGALLAAVIAGSHHLKLALAIGGFFLIGGIIVNVMIPGPIWFTIADIALAYLPMAWLGHRLGRRN